MQYKLIFFICNTILSLLVYQNTLADIVKPALVEISVYTNETYSIEIRTSIEALLTGINSQYKNTKESPNAEAYDALRVLQPNELMMHFIKFKAKFLQQLKLTIDNKQSELKIDKVNIPLPGYTKVPRTSLITLSGTIPRSSKSLIWHYPEAFGDNAVRVRQVDQQNEKWHWSQWQWLRNGQSSQAFSLSEIFTKASLYEVIKSYMVAGFEHILPNGLDHILFIFGIFLFSQKLNPLLWQVTMFTVAHTITLGLSIAGYINLPASIVEPLIALSIAYIGFENIKATSLHKSRLIIVFLFGLLHGLGFARVLAEFGMPEEDFIIALISFNLGVEFGQLAIILAAYISIAFLFKDKPWYRNWVIIPISLVICIIGLYWTYDRFSYDFLINGVLNEIYS